MSFFALDYGPGGQPGPALVFPFIGQDLLMGEHGILPTEEALAELGPWSEALVFGRVDCVACEMRIWPAGKPFPAGLVKGDFRRLWGKWPQGQLEAMSRACQIAAWLHQNRHCGVCGEPMETRMDEPARECPTCLHRAYPRISPVCIGLVLKGDEMLLARSPHFPPGIYSALAGFLEVGESAEECLRREIREEAGIEISNIRWFGSQSWPYPHTLMLGFLADYASGELQPQAKEIEDLRWFKTSGLPSLPHPSTLAFQMITAIVENGK